MRSCMCRKCRDNLCVYNPTLFLVRTMPPTLNLHFNLVNVPRHTSFQNSSGLSRQMGTAIAGPRNRDEVHCREVEKPLLSRSYAEIWSCASGDAIERYACNSSVGYHGIQQALHDTIDTEMSLHVTSVYRTGKHTCWIWVTSVKF